MIIPLIVIGFVGCVLASLVSLSLALAQGRPWQRSLLLPDFGSVRKFPRTGSRLPRGLVIDGFQLVFEAYLLAATMSTAPIQGPVLACIHAGTAIWLVSLGYVVVETRLERRFKSLPAGDPDFDFASELAEKSGIRLAAVRTVRGPVRRPYARLANAIYLSLAERGTLSSKDRQVIIAERLGGLRLRRARTLRNGGILAAQMGLFTAALFVAIHLERRNPSTFIATMAFYSGIALLTLATRDCERWRVRQVDRFLLQSVGDLASVERAITKAFFLRLDAELPSDSRRKMLESALEERKQRLASVAEELAHKALP